jgi:hypothetical protein
MSVFMSTIGLKWRLRLELWLSLLKLCAFVRSNAKFTFHSRSCHRASTAKLSSIRATAGAEGAAMDAYSSARVVVRARLNEDADTDASALKPEPKLTAVIRSSSLASSSRLHLTWDRSPSCSQSSGRWYSAFGCRLSPTLPFLPSPFPVYLQVLHVGDEVVVYHFPHVLREVEVGDVPSVEKIIC